MRATPQAGLTLALWGGLFLPALPTQAAPGHGTPATALPIDFSVFASPNFAGGSGQLTVPGERDYYAFQVYTAGYLQYGVAGLGAGSSLTLPTPEFDLYDSSATQLSSIGGYLYAVNPGVYYPCIWSTSGGTGAYSYSMTGLGQGGFGTATFGPRLTAVPEAGPLPLLALGLGGVLLAARRRRA